MCLFERCHGRCLRSAPSNENLEEIKPEPVHESILDPNFQLNPASEEAEPISSNSIECVVPPGNWINPPAKQWAFSECNESWDTLKPGPHEYEDEFSLELIYNHEAHDNKILYACRWTGWPPEYDTLEPEENVIGSRAFYEYAIASLNLNIGSKRKTKAKRTGALRSTTKKFKPDIERIALKLNLREPTNGHELIMYKILKRNFEDEKYSEATGFYRYLK